MVSPMNGAIADYPPTAPYASALDALQQWRENPDDGQIDKKVQQVSLEWLLSQEDQHWFCSHDGAQKASPEYKKALFEVATFTVRLIGFKATNKVLDWRNHLEHLLQHCHYCVRGWIKAQKNIGPRYLKSKWPETTVANWYASLRSREVERIKNAITATIEKSSSLDVIIYNILCDPALYSDAEICQLLEDRLPDVTKFNDAAPKDLQVPPGIIALLVHPSSKLRRWSSEFLSRRDPLSLASFEDKDLGLSSAIFTVFEQVAKRDRQQSSNGVLKDASMSTTITSDDTAFWHGLYLILDWLSEDIYLSHLTGGGSRFGIMRTVASHLGDKGTHWLEVIRAFRVILEKMDSKAWSNLLEAPTAKKDEVADGVIDAGYAGARLHDALDNKQFLTELQTAKDLDPARQSFIEEALFGWIFYFLSSLRTSRFFQPCFSIVCNRLLDEYGRKSLYDEDLRMRTLKATFKVFNLVYKEATSEEEGSSQWPYERITRLDLERRATLISELAFSTDSEKGSLANKAAKIAQSLLHTLAATDSRALQSYVYKLAALRTRLKEGGKAPEPLEHAPKLCHDLYVRAQNQNDIDFNSTGTAGFVKALAACAHLPRLSSRAWTIKDTAAFDKYIKSDMKMVNEQRENFAKPVCGMLRALANEENAIIQDFLKIEGVAEAIMMLVLCPTESVATQAQSVLRQGFDVSSRIECIRALIDKHPEASLKGVISALRSFKENATRLPEACEQAKRLVRCLTDIITVLCDPTDVMIRDDQWVERNNARGLLSKLWTLMCSNISTIFEKTEFWAPAFENEEMTTWMRDALIFLKEMLEEVRTFEAAATGTSFTSDNPTPRKMSDRGRQMVAALNEPLSKMTAWLRLNDRDLLEQTTTLTVQVLDRFTKARIPVHEEVVRRIRKLADKIKDPKAKRDQLLKPEQIQALVGALARHPDHSEELLHLVNPAKRSAQKDQWGKIFNGQGGLSKGSSGSTSGKITPIDLASDDSDDDTPVVVGSSKGTRPVPSKPDGKGTTRPTKPGLGSSSSKVSGPSSKPNLQVNRSAQGKVASRYRTAPTKMKNAIYSHAAMRAAQGHSSSEEDSDDDTRTKAGLAGFEQPKSGAIPSTRIGKPLQAPQTAEQRKAKMLDLSLNAVQDAQQQAGGRRRGQRIMTAADLAVESQNKARMRYNPDYSDLHRRILQWNLRQNGPTPDPTFRWPQNIPSSFEDVDEYINTFLPLLLLECWSEITSAKEEIQSGDYEMEPFSGVMAGRMTVDDFTEVFISVDRLTDRNAVTENDVVMLSGPVETLGKIHQVIRKQQKIDIVIRCHLGKDDGSVSRSLMNGTHWTIRKLFSLSTVHREYGGLMSLPYYDLLDEILQPTRHGKPEMESVLVDRAMKAYRVNKPQATAILGAMSTVGFSLIQGPPGTGKTKTILGLVGAFISHRSSKTSGTGLATGTGIGEKMLVCAPSNAAVDEIAKRLKEGVYDSEGRKFVPKVVRVGSESAVHASVQDIFLDTLVDKALGGVNGRTAAGEAQAKMAAFRTELQTLKGEREDKRSEKANTAGNTALLLKLNNEISSITQRINDLGDQLDRERDRLTQSNRAMETSKRKARSDVLASADVICTTLSGAGHDYLANFDFETVIIDEAAQSVEISSLIPLKYNCQRCIMVGDPNQLPPTVKSREATRAGYNKSLFVRLHTAAPEATHLLSIQYRMHPDISSFPSKAFYESRLADGPNMEVATKQSWHDTTELFPPYAFLHVRGSREEKGRHHSLMNRQEASVAVALYARLVQECKGVDLAQRVGIVTAYKAQVGELRKQFRARFGPEILDKIDFNTVDGFQGQEKDVIILSCVRGGTVDGTGIGFLSDVRRMNVALTRAKSSLFILGDAKALQYNESWRKLVEDAKDRGVLREVDASSFTLRATAIPKQISPTRKNAVKGKKRESDASKLAILPAPDGLMRPSELAKSTSGLNASDGVKTSLGVKKRLLDNLKTEDSRATDNKRVKREDDADVTPSISNAGSAFAKPVVKKEDSPEEGELMEGIEYHKSDPPAFAINGQPSNGAALPLKPPMKAAGPPAPGTSAQLPPRPAGAPTLVAPSKPSSSMFIPRKKPAAASKPGGVPARRF